METITILEPPLGLIFLIVFTFLFFMLLRQVFIKGILHFKLLKKIYPKELEGVDSYLKLTWISNCFRLNFGVMIWFWTPIYYTYINEDRFKGVEMEYHRKLKLNNKKLGVYFLIYVLIILLFWIFVL
jgi:hypothetical protein